MTEPRFESRRSEPPKPASSEAITILSVAMDRYASTPGYEALEQLYLLGRSAWLDFYSDTMLNRAVNEQCASDLDALYGRVLEMIPKAGRAHGGPPSISDFTPHERIVDYAFLEHEAERAAAISRLPAQFRERLAGKVRALLELPHGASDEWPDLLTRIRETVFIERFRTALERYRGELRDLRREWGSPEGQDAPILLDEISFVDDATEPGGGGGEPFELCDRPSPPEGAEEE